MEDRIPIDWAGIYDSRLSEEEKAFHKFLRDVLESSSELDEDFRNRKRQRVVLRIEWDRDDPAAAQEWYSYRNVR